MRIWEGVLTVIIVLLLLANLWMLSRNFRLSLSSRPKSFFGDSDGRDMEEAFQRRPAFRGESGRVEAF